MKLSSRERRARRKSSRRVRNWVRHNLPAGEIGVNPFSMLTYYSWPWERRGLPRRPATL